MVEIHSNADFSQTENNQGIQAATYVRELNHNYPSSVQQVIHNYPPDSRVQHQQHNRKYASAKDKCLIDLCLTDPRDDKDRIKSTKGDLRKDLYQWILDHHDFKRWRNDEQSRLLWIKGGPGKGKTMLLIGIVEELERQFDEAKQQHQSGSHVNVLSYFFCEGTGDEKDNTVTAVLRGLVYMLADQEPSLAKDLRNKYEREGDKLFKDANAFYALSTILNNMLQRSSRERAYIVVDALDECNTGMLDLLKLIIKNTSTSRAKWIISSRHKDRIERELEPDGMHLSLDLEEEANAKHVSHAVRLYIDNRVSELKLLHGKDELRAKVVKILHEKAGNTFLWVALVVQRLQQDDVGVRDVLKVLKTMPKGLRELYMRMIGQLEKLLKDSREACRQVLLLATFAYRPLHMQEIGALLEQPENDSDDSTDSEDYPDDSTDVEDIVRMCGSFLTLRGGQVYLVHQSAKEYLSESETFDPVEAHHRIFRRSLDLMTVSLRRDIYKRDRPGLLIEEPIAKPEPDPLAPVLYSCVHWVDHISKDRNQEDLVDGGIVHKFLKTHFLHWIEGLSLSGEAYAAVSAIGKLEKILKDGSRQASLAHCKPSLDTLQHGSKESSLLSLTIDAHRFLLYNGWVIKNAPLQTYASALLFSPARSLTRELFKGEERRCVLTGPTVDQHWGPLVRTHEGHSSGVWSVACSPDGKLIASASHDGTIKVWIAATGEIKQMLGGRHWVLSVAFSPDGKSIVSASADKLVKICNTTTGKVQQTLEGHTDIVRSAVFSPNGKLIASASDDQTVKIWNVATGKVRQTYKGNAEFWSVAFSPNGKLIASASEDKTISVWKTATEETVEQILEGHTGTVRSIAFSPDGQLIASASSDKTARIWNLATAKTQQTYQHSSELWSVAFSPDGSFIAAGSKKRGGIVKVCVTPDETHEILEGHADTVRSLTFSPDGKFIISGSHDKTVKVWDATISKDQMLQDHKSEVNTVTFSPDGQLVASASSDRTIKVWNAATGTCLKTLEGHGRGVDLVAFSPDGKLVVSASGEGVLKVWDVALGETKLTPKGPSKKVSSVAFSSDGKHIISESKDKTTNIWDVATGEVKVDPTRPSLPRAQPSVYGLSPSKDWIIFEEQRVLWLPPEYRPEDSKKWCSIVSSQVARLAIGCSSGKVIVISFSAPEPS